MLSPIETEVDRRLINNVFAQMIINDLTGEWIGYYPGHFDEVIRIVQNGPYLEAIKITGDDYVPAGAITWRANLETLEGEGQIAEREFQNPRFVPGKLTSLTRSGSCFSGTSAGKWSIGKTNKSKPPIQATN